MDQIFKGWFIVRFKIPKNGTSIEKAFYQRTTLSTIMKKKLIAIEVDFVYFPI
jgi:hypothetical protein